MSLLVFFNDRISWENNALEVSFSMCVESIDD